MLILATCYSSIQSYFNFNNFILCLLSISKIMNLLGHLAQLFLDTLAFILRKKSEIIGEIFSAVLEMQFVQFYLNIRKYMCKYKHLLTKIETSYIVALLNGTDWRLVDYKY